MARISTASGGKGRGSSARDEDPSRRDPTGARGESFGSRGTREEARPRGDPAPSAASSHREACWPEKGVFGGLGLAEARRTFTKPISLAYSRKHCLQMFRLYLRMIPHWFPHTRLLRREGREEGG